MFFLLAARDESRRGRTGERGGGRRGLGWGSPLPLSYFSLAGTSGSFYFPICQLSTQVSLLFPCDVMNLSTSQGLPQAELCQPRSQALLFLKAEALWGLALHFALCKGKSSEKIPYRCKHGQNHPRALTGLQGL